MSAQESFVDRATGHFPDTGPVDESRHSSQTSASALALAPALGDGVALLIGVAVVGPDGSLGWAYAAVALVLLVGASGWRGRINPRLSDDLPRMLGLLAIPVLLLAPFFPTSELGELVSALIPIITLVLITRGASYWLMRAARSRGLVVEPTLLVGTGQLGVRIADSLRDHPEYGLRPMGFLGCPHVNHDRAEGRRRLRTDRGLPLPLLGPVDRLARAVRELRIRRVIVAFDCSSENEMIPALRECDRLAVEIHVAPRFFELGVAPANTTTDDVWGISLVRLRRPALRSLWWRTKRLIDLVLAAALLILTAPILVSAVVAVRLTSRGPAFFRQVRVGEGGRFFHMIKLRTMRVNEDGDTTWTTQGDPRVTRVGRFLRRTCIDELPQLINVLRGEMSFVGPRPERPHFADQFRRTIQGYGDRQRVPVGMTGWAQVHGLRGDTSITERALFDNLYVEHWSLWRDGVIVARTFSEVLRGKGF